MVLMENGSDNSSATNLSQKNLRILTEPCTNNQLTHEVKDISALDATLTEVQEDLHFSNKQKCRNTGNLKPPYKRKPDYCYYCETEVLNFGRHIIRNHSMELDVAEIISKPIRSRERRSLFDKLRRKGNFLADGGNCFKAVRQTYVPDRVLIPCDNCLGFFSSKLLYRHRKNCGNRSNQERAQFAGQSKMFPNIKIDHRLKEEVFPRMRADKISMEAKNDFLICAFGTRYLKTHREKHFIAVTSRKMRELSKILIEMRKIDPSISTMFSALRPKYFDAFVEATKRIACYDPEKDIYLSPTFAMNIVRSLKQCCDIAITFAYKKQTAYLSVSTATIEAELKTLIHLFETNWSFEVSSQAANNLNLNKWNKVTIVPLANDLKLPRSHLVKLADDATKILQNYLNDATVENAPQKTDSENILKLEDIKAFNNLIESVYCRVILLNRKRSGELQRMYFHTYVNSIGNEKYEEFQKAVSPSEKILLSSMKRVVIRGKRGRGVPVLFNPEVQNHIDILLAVRNAFVPRDNPYLFAPAKSSSHLIGYKILGKHAKLSGAKNATSITSTRLRKHLATLSQLLNLSDGEIEQLATFMGHTPGVHRNSYRLPDDIYQTTKIAKLLMVMENGTANNYKGKSLDEVEIDMDKNLFEDNFSESDDDDDDELKCLLQDDNEPSTSQIENTVSPTKENETFKNKTARKLVPWTDRQKSVTVNFFKNHIKSRRPPKKRECEELKNQFPELLNNKNWLKIKVFIQNRYCKHTN
ncbi:uncharacterized protein [Diabrotica undecimpunctata]|uniref:uncharacterized protein n=1 Tax=Diabrotica undecimpunctata TaxID=50387 RepID=UPI003B63631C